MSSSPAASGSASRSAQARFQGLREELQAISAKLGELDVEADEHRLVIAALQPLEPGRRCHRRLGGVLVQSTVSETLPVLQGTLAGLEGTISGLRDVWKRKDGELSSLGRELAQAQ